MHPTPADYHYDFVIRAWGRAFERHGGREVRSGSQHLDRDASAVMTAWSAQAAVERQLQRLVGLARTITGERRVCLSGGVALNCSANGLIGEPIYVPPVPHDAGVALGAAWQVAPPRATTPLSPYLGPQVTSEMPGASERSGITTLAVDLEQLTHAITAGRIGAIAEGRAEVGPRALGHRSIVASPTPRAMQDRLNLLKNREPWRPFGPVALRSRCDPLWERREHLSRYMIGSVPVTEAAHATIPAAIHVDGTTRPQALDDESTDLVARLLAQPAPTARAALVNTSFNTRGKPIVNTGRDALHAFRAMDLDFLVLAGEVHVKGADWWRAR
jgi:carbamoyltransferase